MSLCRRCARTIFLAGFSLASATLCDVPAPIPHAFSVVIIQEV